MKYYTIQNLKAWKEANKKGFLAGNKDYIDEEWFSKPYTWMMTQMSKRLKNYNNEYPIWLWLDVSNIQFCELLDEDWVLLEIELKEDEVLLSHFEAWHIVLNNDYLDDENLMETKEESWEHIFDKDKLEVLGYGFDKDDLQGTAGAIDCKNIKVLKYILTSL